MDTIAIDSKPVKTEIVTRILTLSSDVTSPDSYQELTRLTGELIKQYNVQGRLDNDPFMPTRERTLNVPFGEINNELNDSTCVITGGLGCVGTILVNELLKFNVKSIIIIDNRKDPLFIGTPRVTNVYCDIRSLRKLQDVFFTYQPDFVFHLAAVRDPGFAEKHVVETVTTNVLGTINVIQASEATGTVKQLIYASTGKASRYFTEEIYAASKKVTEFVLDSYAKSSEVKYGIVRFTHILNNSLMNGELKYGSLNDDYVSVHSPGKYVTAQNGTEAAQLMLNALVYSKEKESRLFLVKNLEWPVESLEVALFHIKSSGRAIPVIFKGNPTGYCEKFFRGQFDWSHPDDHNLLINVFESKHTELNSSHDIIISRPCSVDRKTLDRVVRQLVEVRGEAETRRVLIYGLRQLVKESLKTVDKKETVNVLKWGLDSKILESENARVTDFGDLVPLLMESLEGTEYYKEVEDLILQPV